MAGSGGRSLMTGLANSTAMWSASLALPPLPKLRILPPLIRQVVIARAQSATRAAWSRKNFCLMKALSLAHSSTRSGRSDIVGGSSLAVGDDGLAQRQPPVVRWHPPLEVDLQPGGAQGRQHRSQQQGVLEDAARQGDRPQARRRRQAGADG